MVRYPLLLALLAALCVPAAGHAADKPAPAVPTPFATAMTADDLDGAAFTQWVDGVEKPFEVKDGPRHVVWTATSRPEWDGLVFSDSKKTGSRYMRIGWKTPRLVGTVLARAGGRLSVLKEGAAYPGALSDDSQWIPAMRIKSGAVSGDEAGREDIAVWILPPKTTTRAIRFSHAPEITDKTFAGWLGAVAILGDRLATVANQATAITTHTQDHAGLINNDSNDQTWGCWSNGQDGAELPLSREHPETIVLEWSKPVALRGLCALFAGFGTADVAAFTGPDSRHAREATEADWSPIASFAGIENGYPVQLWPNWMDFGSIIITRAIRLSLTSVCQEGHPHLHGNTKGGKRTWLGELLAFSPLGAADLATVILPTAPAADMEHPPIAVTFTLAEAGTVTLVIDDKTGKRVRNLISETPFPAGASTVWWDGMDDLGRDPEAARHGLYHIPAAFVEPGAYTVRGLTHKPLDLHFEFSVYNAGSPAWTTEDGTGGWTTNHTPPESALFVPADKAPGGKPLVYIGSFVSEGGHGLIWIDPDGKKVGGRANVGGAWTGAQNLARDAGPQADPKAYAYVGTGWEQEIRLTALTSEGDKTVVKFPLDHKEDSHLAGIAVHNGLMVCSLPKLKELAFVDVTKHAILGTATLADTSGVAFAADGTLLVIAGKQVLRLTLPKTIAGAIILPPGQVVVDRLEDPHGIAVDSRGAIYLTDHGASHQVKVFTAEGKPVRTIGKPGPPKAGPYDPEHMNNPAGVTIDANDHIWVAEADFQPKRVSEWTMDGKLVKAFYGPSMYGGGGTLDFHDKNRFYFNGMEFALDWTTGTDRLASVFFRTGSNDQFPPDGYGSGGMPETPHYVAGRRFFSNWNDCNPTNGAGIACIWEDRDGVAVPVAALGQAQDWKLLREDPAFTSAWPSGCEPKGDRWKNMALFMWTDKNGDGRVQPDEITMIKAQTGGVTVMPDLAMVVARVDGKTMRYPVKLNGAGISYDLAAGEVLATDVQGPTSSGGDQALASPDGWTVLSLGAKPFAAQSVSGVFKGVARWSYPDQWPGLHASHEAPVPSFPGELIGTTRFLGSFLTPKGSDVGPVWAINGNMGPMFLITADGLFVATIFKDVRTGHSWSMPVAERGMVLNDVSTHDENFWPSITQTPDGNVYVVDGGRTSLVLVDHLDSLRRLPDAALTVTDEMMAQAHEFQTRTELARQKVQGSGVLKVALRRTPPGKDASLAAWTGADWATIDRRGTAANFNSNSRPYDVAAAACVAGGKLYVVWRTTEKDLLRNSGDQATAPFKTGGCLDVMIGVDPAANEQRGNPTVGDMRLLVTRVKDKTVALLYRAKVPGTKEPVPFSSPWRTITIDRVDPVGDQVELVQQDTTYQISIPLATLGLAPADGQVIKADVGVLRGDGMSTTQRVYWSNKGTAITSDVPSEAMLVPALWGKWRFVTVPE
jgi:hypothetical protein